MEIEIPSLWIKKNPCRSLSVPIVSIFIFKSQPMPLHSHPHPHLPPSPTPVILKSSMVSGHICHKLNTTGWNSTLAKQIIDSFVQLQKVARWHQKYMTRIRMWGGKQRPRNGAQWRWSDAKNVPHAQHWSMVKRENLHKSLRASRKKLKNLLVRCLGFWSASSPWDGIFNIYYMY